MVDITILARVSLRYMSTYDPRSYTLVLGSVVSSPIVQYRCLFSVVRVAVLKSHVEQICVYSPCIVAATIAALYKYTSLYSTVE